MSDLPPDVERLRVIRLYLQMQLDAVDARLAQAEQGAARSTATNSAPLRISRDVGWRLESIPGPNGGPGRGVVHRGDCPSASGGWLNRRELAVALEQAEVTPCPKCRPED